MSFIYQIHYEMYFHNLIFDVAEVITLLYKLC
jgi:hypothetical protein